MKFHKNKFLTTVSAIALVLAVGACSSSNDDEMALTMNGDGDATNGDGDATNGDDDTKTPAETLADARDALTALPADATDEAEEMAQELVDEALRLPGNEAELIASLDAEVAQAEERQSALDVTEQERQANADELQNAEDALANASAEDKEAAQAAVDEALQMPGNEAALIASLEQQVDDAAQAKKVADAADAAKEVSAMAKAVIKAIRTNTGLEAGDNPTAPMVTLAASPAGELTATLEGYTMSAAPEEIAGWRGRTLAKDGDTTVIYTNIMDEVPTSLDDLYARASGLPKAPQTYTVTTTGGGSTINWEDAKRVDGKEDVDRSGDEPVTTFAGSVRGVDGTFSCTTTCTAPVPDGETGLLSSSDMWSFAPTDPNAKINVKDEAYVSFGWWLNAMGTAGAYEFDAFASVEGMGDDDGNTGSGMDLKGSATYKGGAAGKWAMQSTTDDSASGGHFTANATLTANFDANLRAADAADTVAANKDGVSIGGKIDGFMTGDVSRPNWKVTLSYDAMPDNDADPGVQFLGDVAPITGPGATTKWATGGAVDGVGTWNANFYGEDDDDHPTAVVGEFNAAIGGEDDIARISGAFGATK